MIIKKLSAFLLAASMLLTFSACSAPKTDGSSSTPSSLPSSTASVDTPSTPEPVAPTKDREGKDFTMPAKTDKIISMAPSITETLINLGLGDNIIAIDTYSAGRDGLKADIPQFDMMTPDTEAIAALKPDIIFATGMSQANGEDPFKAITDLGVIMTYIPSASSIEGIVEDIDFIGTVTNTHVKAREIIAKMEQDIADVVAKIGDTKTDKTVYFEISAAPSAYSFGTGTFLNEMIELLGAKNAFADQESWIAVTEEAAIAKNPSVIFTNVDYTEDPVGEILARNGWDVVTAVKEKAVYQIDKNSSSLPNENIVKALSEMAKAIHPDLF